MRNNWKRGDEFGASVVNGIANELTAAIQKSDTAANRVDAKVDAATTAAVAKVKDKIIPIARGLHSWSNLTIGGDKDNFYLVNFGPLYLETLTITKNANTPFHSGGWILKVILSSRNWDRQTRCSKIIHEEVHTFGHWTYSLFRKGVISNSHGTQQKNVTMFLRGGLSYKYRFDSGLEMSPIVDLNTHIT